MFGRQGGAPAAERTLKIPSCHKEVAKASRTAFDCKSQSKDIVAAPSGPRAHTVSERPCKNLLRGAAIKKRAAASGSLMVSAMAFP